jgi:hypothetical protein
MHGGSGLMSCRRSGVRETDAACWSVTCRRSFHSQARHRIRLRAGMPGVVLWEQVIDVA